MRIRILHVVAAILIGVLAVPCFAATYDATSQGFLETSPDQALNLIMNDISISETDIDVALTHADDSLFMVPDEILTLDNLFYSDSGSAVCGDSFFEPSQNETLDLGGPIGSPFESDLFLAGFSLSPENCFVSDFSVAGLSNAIASTTNKAGVPTPAPAWFFGTGVVGLFEIRRRLNT